MANSPGSGPASPAKSPAKSPASGTKLPAKSPASGTRSPAKSPGSPSKSPTSPGKDTAPGPATVSDPTILPASHWQQTAIPVNEDNDYDDADSVFGGSVGSSTDSLSESILKYRTIQGRTYHSERGRAEAWIPNDEAQCESMDIYHHLCTLVLGGKLHLAPLSDDVQKVLDIGTGTGIWAIDFADQYPSAEVTGTDVSPIQPKWVPPNCKFELEDANESRWSWPDNTFDYVHIRILFGSIIDWYAFYKEAFRVCKPGGWVEDYENNVNMESDDGTVKEKSAMGQWAKVYWEGGKLFGRTFRVLEEDLQRKGMEAAGFVDITVKDVKCPVGTWPKDVEMKTWGAYARSALETDIEGYVLYIWGTVLGWSQTEIQVYLAHMRQQLHDNRVHAFYRHRIVYGRKPE